LTTALLTKSVTHHMTWKKAELIFVNFNQTLLSDMKYISSRGKESNLTFEQVLFSGT
jgi:hypothetical protein